MYKKLTIDFFFNPRESALDEASAINNYLKALRPYCERLTQTPEFAELKPIFKPMMHTVMLIWTRCKEFQQPAKLVSLLQQIHNDIIDQAVNFLYPEDILRAELDEATERIQIVLSVLNAFQQAFEEYKLIVSSKVGETVKPWSFDERQSFARLNEFIARVRRIADLFTTMSNFARLEKVEIGGTRVIIPTLIRFCNTPMTSAQPGQS